MFDLNEVQAFVYIAKYKSFRKAAREIGMPQSSLSRGLAHLEESVGAQLVKRTTRSVVISTAGQNFLVYANAILRLADKARRQFEDPPNEGTLRLGIVEDYVAGDLHQVLGLFRRHYPRFSISLKTGISANLYEALEDDMLDIVLSKRLRGREKGRFLFSEPLVWVGDERLVGDRDSALPLATYPAPGTTRTLMLETLRSYDRRWTIAAESASMAGLIAAISAGFAISAFPRRFCPTQVAMLEGTDLPPLGSLEYVIDQRAAPRDAAIDAFVEMLVATVTASSEVDGHA